MGCISNGHTLFKWYFLNAYKHWCLVRIIFVSYVYFKGNVAIVDTPGIGDIDQKEVEKKMMDYLPNALAFVFVINVAAAGGLQKDRVIA